MKRDEVAAEVYEGYTGLPFPKTPVDDNDKHMVESAYKHADKILALLTQLPPERDVNTVIDWLNSHDMHEEAKQIEDISSKCKCTACNPAAG